MFCQCFCLDNLNVNLTSFEPVLTSLEEKQSSNVVLTARSAGSGYTFAMADTPCGGGRLEKLSWKREKNLTFLKKCSTYLEDLCTLWKGMH